MLRHWHLAVASFKDGRVGSISKLENTLLVLIPVSRCQTCAPIFFFYFIAAMIKIIKTYMLQTRGCAVGPPILYLDTNSH